MLRFLLFAGVTCVFTFLSHGQKAIIQTDIFYPEKEYSPADFFSAHVLTGQIPAQTTFRLENRGFHKFNKNHLKYRQYHQDVPVYGYEISLHLKEGKVDHVTGKIAPKISALPEYYISKETILASIEAKLLAEINTENKINGSVDVESCELIWSDRFFPEKTGDLCLAYHVFMSIPSLEVHREYILQATTGDVIFTQDLVCSYFPKGTAPSYHYGTVEIETEQVEANKFQLRDVTRGDGNSTFINKGSSDFLPSDDDNVWAKFPDIALGHVAYDAHFCTARFYDFLEEHFDYSGINGNGRSMIARVNINNGADLVNAFWNNQNAAFGNGNCHYHPLTTRSIIGHEFAHGITSENAKLIYSGESGAMNEAFSDIIGKAFEMIDDPTNFDWPIGHEIVATRFAKPLRSMEDPTIYNNPKMYKGKHWRDGGSVHSNSGVLNHWFYLLVNGGSGKNELDTAYQVTPVAVQDILDIVFLCQTSYLQPASTYPNMFEYSKLACGSLFGINSPQYQSMLQAWKAVGLPYIGTPIDNYDDLVLTAKIKNDPNNSYTCYDGQYPEINITLANKGTIFYPQGTIFGLGIIRNGQTIQKNFSLPDSLPPDSTLVIAIPDYELVTKTEYYSLEINLLHNDHVQSNNRFYLYFQNFATKGVDLQISGISHTTLNCFAEEIVFSVRVKNQSCFTAPAGTAITLKMDNLDTGETYYFDHITTLPIGPRQETAISARIPYDWNSINFAYAITSSEDSISDNNTSQYTVKEKGVIDEQIQYTFDNEAFDLDFKHNSPYSRFSFENDYYFRTKTNFSTTNSPCLEEDKNFKNVNSGVAQYTVAETCLDVSNFAHPGLRFDMRQFRSDYYNDFPELEGNSTILKLEFTSLQQNYYPDLIKNTDVGISQKYEYIIPQGFKGLFKIIAFTSRHDGSSAINVKNDAILLDNLEIFDIVGTEEFDREESILLSPNPASDYVKIVSSNKDIHMVRLLDITGKQMLEYSFLLPLHEVFMPMQKYPSGIYLAEITSSTGIIIKKFIK